MTTFLSRISLFLLVGFAVLSTPVSAQQNGMDDNASNVVETAVQADGFDTLVKALKAADLAGDLQGEGPFTVFAPTDEAFQALPDGRLESLLQPENKDQLRAVLRYHVLGGKAMASDVTSADSASTFEGRSVRFQVENGGVTLMGQNTATVVQADLEASNGVVHVIDSVLLPPEQNDGM